MSRSGIEAAHAQESVLDVVAPLRKARIVAESFVPGASVSGVATRHGVTASTLSQWRRQAVRGELGPVPGVPAVPAVVPVVIGEGADPSTSAPAAVSDAGSHPAQRRWPVSEKMP